LYITDHCGELLCEKEAQRALKDRKSGVKLQALAIPAVTILAIMVSFIDPAMSMWCYLLIPIILVIPGRVHPPMSKIA
jgi:hypothetical protein